MTVAAAASKGKKKAINTALRREGATLRTLIRRLVNGILNRIFALDVKGSHRRRNILRLLFILAGFIFILELYPWSFWAAELQLVFGTAFTQPNGLTTVFVDFFSQLFTALSDPRVVRLLPIFILPFLLAKEFAAHYLADIFELKDINIARRFIDEVALRGGGNELHISAASINQKEVEESPIVRIGGPGYVTIELDTALLVEKPDGRSRVIPPGNRWVLDGFERIRDKIDLRDQIPHALEINARSRDGIPISVTDVNAIFNIYRGSKKPTPNQPYPFNEKAFRTIVYKKANRVTEGEKIHQKWYRSTGESDLMQVMKSLVTSELGKFMSSHELSEYLASVGAPEVLAIQRIKNAIANGNALPDEQPSVSPEFMPRSEISKLFNEFNKKFNDEQEKRGVQSQWVGVGAWKMPPGIPSQVIPEKHIEAWKLTIENMKLRSNQALENIERDASLLELQLIARNGPIHIHHANRDLNLDYPQAFRSLFNYYLDLLTGAITEADKNGKPIAPSVVAAYYSIVRQESHRPEPQSPNPQSNEEKQLFEEAKARVGRNVIVEKLLDLEEKLHPGTSRVERLKRIITAWDKDMPDEPRRTAEERPPRSRRQGQAEQPRRDAQDTPSPDENDLYPDLLVKVLGDTAAAERLIDFERVHFPDETRLDWIRRAIQRWIDDNR